MQTINNTKYTKNITLSEQVQTPIEKSWKEIVDNHNIQIHDHSISWLGTGTSIKSGGVKLVLFVISSLKRNTAYLLKVDH